MAIQINSIVSIILFQLYNNDSIFFTLWISNIKYHKTCFTYIPNSGFDKSLSIDSYRQINNHETMFYFFPEISVQCPDIVKCFSIVFHLNQLNYKGKAEAGLEALNCIRVMAISFVIIGHRVGTITQGPLINREYHENVIIVTLILIFFFVQWIFRKFWKFSILFVSVNFRHV